MSDAISSENSSRQELLAEIASLRDRLLDSEETLRAIGSGEVDAFIVTGSEGEQIFTLEGADHPYRVMVETMQEGAVNLAADGTILYANHRMATMLQVPLEDLLGQQFEAYVTPANRTYFESLLESNVHQRVSGELALLTKAGEPLPVQVSFGVNSHSDEGAISAVFTDLTERKRVEVERQELERKMFESQKLESLGVLAGGIAHDFNNIMMAILGNTSLCQGFINPESPATDNLKMIEEAATRAADLAGQMLAYAGRGKFVIEPVDINRLLTEMINMLEVAISRKANLRLKLTPDLPPVEGDATQLRQVLLNLIINASEAIGETNGAITISTDLIKCDQSYLQSAWPESKVDEGSYLLLEISDTGCGMSQETLAKIFDPFFSTKFTGRGLGLAALLGIINSHKGAVRADSEPGNGTSFKVLLPANARLTKNSSEDAAPNCRPGHGTILLVDDEDLILEVGSRMLQELGFKTITAKDGYEALDLVKETPDIDAAILDLTMPHMDGEQCFRELRQIHPELKIIIASGYSEIEVSEKFIGKGLVGFLQKPYSLSTLRQTLQTTDDSSRVANPEWQKNIGK